MESIAAAAMLTGLVSAHSWVHCTDYRGDTTHYEPNACFGNPRPIDGKVPGMTPFGTDTGFNQQPGATLCHSDEATHPSYPMANYQRGQQITLTWPAKNHVAADCTNQYIPDTSLALYVAPFTSLTAENAWTKVPASFSDDPHVSGDKDYKGFQNCPDFCNNMDKSLCTGWFLVPENLGDGDYTFQWRWEFNANTTPYVTCFEATVAGDFDGTIEIPTPLPTEVNQTAPPTAPPANCGGAWSQCGGSAMSYTCCEAGLACQKKDDYYSQCRASCPTDETWECAQGTGPAPTSPPTEPPTAPPTEDACTNKANGNPCGETCCEKLTGCTYTNGVCVTAVPTQPPVASPTAPPQQCTSSRVQFNSGSKKHKADDATECWEKCQENKTQNSAVCMGWEWVEGETKPCRLYTDASTTVAGLRDCHPTEGQQ